MKLTVCCCVLIVLGSVQGDKKMSKDQLQTMMRNMIPMVNKGVCAAREYEQYISKQGPLIHRSSAKNSLRIQDSTSIQAIFTPLTIRKVFISNSR